MTTEEFRGHLMAALHAPGGEELATAIVDRCPVLDLVIEDLGREVATLNMITLLESHRQSGDSAAVIMERIALVTALRESIREKISATIARAGHKTPPVPERVITLAGIKQ